MRLNKIEIKGFKSFGDKTVINFNKGVTGIVGPNGCGKSNVVDAMRWVLGEQKTSLLRSDKMENIIFNGSKSRKKLQLAEVSISFDNTKNLIPTEYSTVTVTRKYFRSGDSEYLLNDVKCRLKDITNLFLDTGISSNNYAIIELSMVDNILNDKDNSRLSLFEEAADNFSTIISLLNTSFYLSTLVDETKTLSSINWDGKNPREVKLLYVPKHVPLEIGYSVITSSFDSIFPKGIEVGKISSINEDTNSNFYDVDILLSEDFYSIYNVYLVKSFPFEEKINLEKID